MTEDEFKLRTGMQSDSDIRDALIEYFRAIGWHDAVRVVESTALGAEIPNLGDELADAEAAGWEKASKLAVDTIEKFQTNSVELRGKIANAVQDALA